MNHVNTFFFSALITIYKMGLFLEGEWGKWAAWWVLSELPFSIETFLFPAGPQLFLFVGSFFQLHRTAFISKLHLVNLFFSSDEMKIFNLCIAPLPWGKECAIPSMSQALLLESTVSLREKTLEQKLNINTWQILFS